jgi:hypothetical protein
LVKPVSTPNPPHSNPFVLCLRITTVSNTS